MEKDLDIIINADGESFDEINNSYPPNTEVHKIRNARMNGL